MIPFDKILHLAAGFILTIGVYFILTWDPWICFGIGFVFGLAKEMFWDFYLGRGVSEMIDWLATVFGSLLATLLILLIS